MAIGGNNPGVKVEHEATGTRQVVQSNKAVSQSLVTAGAGAVVAANQFAELAGKAVEAAKAIGEFAKAGAQAKQVDKVFKELGKSSEDLKKLQAATAGFVDATTLQQYSNLTTKLRLTGAEAENAAKAVTAAGIALDGGVNVAELLTKATTGSAEAMRALGIDIDITSDSFKGLSESQKKAQVFRELAIIGSKTNASALQSEMGAYLQLETEIDNFVSDLQVATAEWIQSSGVMEMVGGVLEEIKQFYAENREAIERLVSQGFKVLQTILGPTIKSIGMLMEAFEDLEPFISAGLEALDLFNRGTSVLMNPVSSLIDLFDEEAVASDNLTASIRGQAKSFGELARAQAKAIEVATGRKQTATTGGGGPTTEQSEATSRYLDLLSEVGATEALIQTARDSNLDSSLSALDELVESISESNLEDERRLQLLEAYGQAEEAFTKEFTRGSKRRRSAVEKAGTAWWGLNDAILATAVTVQNDLGPAFRDAMAAFTGPDVIGGIEETGAAIDSLFAPLTATMESDAWNTEGGWLRSILVGGGEEASLADELRESTEAAMGFFSVLGEQQGVFDQWLGGETTEDAENAIAGKFYDMTDAVGVFAESVSSDSAIIFESLSMIGDGFLASSQGVLALGASGGKAMADFARAVGAKNKDIAKWMIPFEIAMAAASYPDAFGMFQHGLAAVKFGLIAGGAVGSPPTKKKEDDRRARAGSGASSTSIAGPKSINSRSGQATATTIINLNSLDPRSGARYAADIINEEAKISTGFGINGSAVLDGNGQGGF